MKTVFFTAALFINTYAMACPQLAGTYTCDYGNGPEIMTVEQNVKGGITEYIIDGYVVLADGQAYPQNDESFSGTTTTSCVGQDVSQLIVGNLLENGTDVGDINVTSSFVTSSTGVNLVSVGEITYGDQTAPINETIACTKN